ERLSFVSFLPSLGSLVLVRLHVGQEEGQIRLGSLAQRLPPRRAGDSWERGCRRQCLGSWGAQAGELSALPVGALARGCALMFTGCRHRFSLKRNALRLRVRLAAGPFGQQRVVLGVFAGQALGADLLARDLPLVVLFHENGAG